MLVGVATANMHPVSMMMYNSPHIITFTLLSCVVLNLSGDNVI